MKDIPIENLMQHADSLYRFALSRVKDHHVAEELVQECRSVAWQCFDTFDARSSLATWLIGIMKFKVIDYFRRSKRTPTDQNVDRGDDVASAAGVTTNSASVLLTRSRQRLRVCLQGHGILP